MEQPEVYCIPPGFQFPLPGKIKLKGIGGGYFSIQGCPLIELQRCRRQQTFPVPAHLDLPGWNLETSFVTGLKRLAKDNDMMVDLMGQLETSYATKKGYWKGGTVSVFGYGGGIIPRFSEVSSAFPESKEFHTLRVQPPAGNYYTTDMLNQLADSWEKHGSGLVTFHGQTGNIMFIGTTTEKTQSFFDEINESVGISVALAPAYVLPCHALAQPAAKCHAPTNPVCNAGW